ncbi:AraC family transcriptional regulator [Isoptericola sp. NPDC057191]|uniref:AraC family transcriptional regulator n=1 Tax=Isoptericola sp. NPDC057191 TaxID=3346041 RepID=UPI0036395959
MFEISLAEPIFFYKAGEFTAPAGWRHKRLHHQRDFEIFLGVTGTVPLLVDGEPVELGPGTCVMTPPGATVEGAAETTEETAFYWLHFFADWQEIEDGGDPGGALPGRFAGELDRVRNGGFSAVLNDVCLLPPRFSPSRWHRAVLALRQVLDAANRFRYSQRECDFLTGALLVELTDDYLRGRGDAVEGRRPRAAPVAEWIRSHISADLTVAEVARSFKVNPDYLNRTFKAAHGTNLRDYILDLKIETAKVLLVRTDLPVGQVAHHSHFRDSRNFLKRFRERAGVTPSEFRAAYAATHLNNEVIDPRIPVPQAAEAYLRGAADAPPA